VTSEGRDPVQTRQTGTAWTLDWAISRMLSNVELLGLFLFVGGAIGTLNLVATVGDAGRVASGARVRVLSVMVAATALFVWGLTYRYAAAAVGDSDGSSPSATLRGILVAFPRAVGVIVAVAAVPVLVLGVSGLVIRSPFDLLIGTVVSLAIVVQFSLALPAVFLDGVGVTTGLHRSWAAALGNQPKILGLAVAVGTPAAVLQLLSGLTSGLPYVALMGLLGVVLGVGHLAYARTYLESN